MGITTGYWYNGQDIGMNLVEKSYLIDRYPELYVQYRFAGLWQWGDYVFQPVQTVAGGENWQLLTDGGYTARAAIKTDSTLWLWGSNDYGQLGDGTRTPRSSPVQTVSGGTNWKLVVAGEYHTTAIKTDGTLWGWGENLYGELGDNTTTLRSSPVQTVSGGTNWKSVATAYFNTAAIKTDGTLWLWGYNVFGQLGDDTFTDKSSPIQTISGGTNWKQVSLGKYHSTAIKTDGTLWGWGDNTLGQLGIPDNTYFESTSPIQTSFGGTNWKLVGAGGYWNIAIRDDSEDLW